MVWLLALALALDLTEIRSEPNLEKRSERALAYADESISAAREAYKQGKYEDCGAALKEVESAVQLSYESLLATGKNPRKNSKPFKNAEKASREILRRLNGLRDLMSAVDHGLIDPAMKSINDVHDRLVTGIMGGNK
jgi:hypothetical protein